MIEVLVAVSLARADFMDRATSRNWSRLVATTRALRAVGTTANARRRARPARAAAVQHWHGSIEESPQAKKGEH